jgi:hypothetical protein
MCQRDIGVAESHLCHTQCVAFCVWLPSWHLWCSVYQIPLPSEAQAHLSVRRATPRPSMVGGWVSGLSGAGLSLLVLPVLETLCLPLALQPDASMFLLPFSLKGAESPGQHLEHHGI